MDQQHSLIQQIEPRARCDQYGNLWSGLQNLGRDPGPFEEVLEHLPPRENFYLETSNAAHTLEPEAFVRLLRLHGAERVLFGTDWPWFGQQEELDRIGNLADRAGYSSGDKDALFGGNAAGLLGLAEG